MVRPYTDSDFEQVQEWGKKWGTSYDKDLLSPLGFIWPGVCAYFCYETPTKVCWLENMIKNPDMPKELTDIAIQAVVTELLKEVNKRGYKVAHATTDNQAVIDRAIAHKAKAVDGQTQLTLRFK